MSEDKKGAGLRYNSGKTRLELVSNLAVNEMAKVYTYGAEKYTLYNEDGTIKSDGSNNWRNGMKWSTVLASLKRHISAFENGEDFDLESSQYHLAHAMTNCSFLLEYYKIYPQGDDRSHKYLNMPKIGLDLDHVIVDWETKWCETFNIKKPLFWDFTYDIKKQFDTFSKSELENFYLNLKPLISPENLPFVPKCYITSRSIDNHINERWIYENGFPTVPVYNVDFGCSKLEVAKKEEIDIMIDDNINTFIEFNKNGILCLLYDASHNKSIDVGYKRVYNFEDFKNRFL